MTLSERIDKAQADFDKAKTQADIWAREVLVASGRLAALQEVLTDDEPPSQAVVEVTPNGAATQ